MSMPAVVEFDQVVKDFTTGVLRRRTLRALAGISLTIHAAEVVGLLGPNRAGKTTLIKILLSLTRPTGGRVSRWGQPLARRATLSRIGYLHERQAFPPYLSATSILDYYGALALVSKADLKRRVPALLDQVGLADRADEPVSRFSKGMIARLGLAQALVNAPDLLVLDEPTEGLDLSGRQLVREAVRQQRQEGKSVLLVTHAAAEVEALCDRVGVLVGGRLVFSGRLDECVKDPESGKQQPMEKALARWYGRPAA